MTQEQAQTVAEIRERSYNATTYGINDGQSVNDRATLLQIIDSQTAENERLNTENNARSLALDAARSEIERLTKEREILREAWEAVNDYLRNTNNAEWRTRWFYACKAVMLYDMRNRTLTQDEIDEMREAH